MIDGLRLCRATSGFINQECRDDSTRLLYNGSKGWSLTSFHDEAPLRETTLIQIITSFPSSFRWPFLPFWDIRVIGWTCIYTQQLDIACDPQWQPTFFTFGEHDPFLDHSSIGHRYHQQ